MNTMLAILFENVLLLEHVDPRYERSQKQAVPQYRDTGSFLALKMRGEVDHCTVAHDRSNMMRQFHCL